LTFRFITRPGHPTFTDLPWELALDEWDDSRLLTPVRGIGRHVVRFVAYGPDLYALKELPDPIAEREYRLLRELEERNVPVVDAVGVATGRTDQWDQPLAGVLVTRHLPFSLPYRALFAKRSRATQWPQMLDALKQLLVRLHLAGFFWGDCSLNNALFRRDAGALAAYLVDAETGELHDVLSAGQRLHDLELACENVAGDLFDLQAGELLDESVDPVEVVEELRRGYLELWAEVVRDARIASPDSWEIDERVQRLNAMGFDVREVQLVEEPDGWHLRLTTQVVEPGHHQRRLQSLTGLYVGENQARVLLNDIELHRCRLEQRTGQPLSGQVGAVLWLTEVFEPTLALVPEPDRGKLEDAELYHQILEHRWFRSEQEGRDIGAEAAVESYVGEMLLNRTGEQRVIDPAMRRPEG
jgi:hypothetical protein